MNVLSLLTRKTIKFRQLECLHALVFHVTSNMAFWGICVSSTDGIVRIFLYTHSRLRALILYVAVSASISSNAFSVRIDWICLRFREPCII